MIAFRGGYHGSVLAFAGGVAENNVDPGDWILCQYNCVSDLEETFQWRGKEVAAVILEAMQGSAGSFPASKEFLDAARRLSKEVRTYYLIH